MKAIQRLSLILFIGTLVACGGSGGTASVTSSSLSTAISSSSSSSFAASVASAVSSNTSSQASSVMTNQFTVVDYLVVDQFGYLPSLTKIAVVRKPIIGYDAGATYTPSNQFELIDEATGSSVITLTATAWKSGTTDNASGDKTWWLDFSSVTTKGRYYLVDKTHQVRSPSFSIDNNVYKPVLKHAFRTFYYQRAGFAKTEPYAEAAWVDGASHIKAGQDTEARSFFDKNNAATAKDVSGGWFDAGDYNKYTNWHADYLITLLHAYRENPAAWGDDFDLPESGNGISDLLDEVKWGFDYLSKLQAASGAMISVVGLSEASPPSATTGPSYYGKENTSATLTSAAAFALGSKIFTATGNEQLISYGEQLAERAQLAWRWASENPDVVFNNNSAVDNSQGLAAGNQEVDAAGRAAKKIQAAIYLTDAIGGQEYSLLVNSAVNNNLPSWVNIWNEWDWTHYLYYSNLSTVDATVAQKIKTTYAAQIKNTDPWKIINNEGDAYRASIATNNITWGSNRSMAKSGSLLMHLPVFSVDSTSESTAKNAAIAYLNYLHGTNPLAMAYLSNMYDLGVHKSVNEFYHSWFRDGSALWDRVGESTYGPAPGYLVGGPNPHYDWDAACKSATPHASCGIAAPTPPKSQPALKSYADFNTSWPLNSWEITENHNDYQVAYLRLLSKFVTVDN